MPIASVCGAFVGLEEGYGRTRKGSENAKGERMGEVICLHASRLRRVDSKTALIFQHNIGVIIQSDKEEKIGVSTTTAPIEIVKTPRRQR